MCGAIVAPGGRAFEDSVQELRQGSCDGRGKRVSDEDMEVTANPVAGMILFPSFWAERLCFVSFAERWLR